MLDFDAIADEVIDVRQKAAAEFVSKLKKDNPDVYDKLKAMTTDELFRELIYSIEDADFVTCSSIHDELHKE